MRTEAVALAHQSLLAPRFRRMAVELSEYTFSNTYLFRHIHNFEVVFNKDIYIRGRTRDGHTYLMPTSPLDEIDFSDLMACMAECEFLFPVPEAWRPFFDESRFEIHALDQDSDYLYSAEKMSTFSGRDLSSRRNLVKQFKKHYPDHRVVPLSSQNSRDAIAILEEWKTHALSEDDVSDYAECLELLHLFDRLGVQGRIIYAQGQPAGFITGEPLTPSVFLFNFAKALTQFKGVYQFLYQNFAQSCCDASVRWINLEQDLGLPDLQQAKRSYLPDHLAPKLRIRAKPSLS